MKRGFNVNKQVLLLLIYKILNRPVDKKGFIAHPWYQTLFFIKERTLSAVLKKLARVSEHE